MRFVVVATLVMGACVQSATQRCGDLVCPDYLVCRLDQQICVRQDQIDACSGKSDGDPCPDGACSNGVCIESRCGDGVANGLEDCDGDDLRGKDCFSAAGYYSGELACGADCRYNLTGCVAGGKCGDGILDRARESCDKSDLDGLTCLDFGYYAPGQLQCSGACTDDVSMCSEKCGDGVVNGPEVCDGAPPTADACAQQGHDAGWLGCSSACVESTLHCADLATVPQNIPDTGGVFFEDAWGTGNTFFLVGDSGRTLRSDGGAWNLLQTTATNLFGVSGTSTSDVFAVGNSTGGAVFHFDGNAWVKMANVPAVPTLEGVFARASNDVWAVGLGGTVIHYDGTAWTLTSPAPTTYELRSVWGFSANDVWAVGQNGTIAHYTGTWSAITLSGTPFLNSVWGPAPNDLYAVAATGQIYHYTGTWQLMPIMLGQCANSGGWHDIYGLPNGNILAAGYYGNSSGGVVCQLVDGAWIEVPSAVAYDLYAIFGTPEAGFVTAGKAVLRAAGASWLPSIPSLPATVGGNAFTTVDASYIIAPNNIISVGASGASTPKIAKFDGTSWVSMTASLNAYPLHAIDGSGTGAIAVGDFGAITKLTGTTWSDMTTPTTNPLRGIDVLDATHAFAVGDLGTIIQLSGTTWTTMTSNTTSTLNAVSAVTTTDVWAVGDDHVILHYNGTWQPAAIGIDFIGATGTDVFFHTVLALAANNVWIGGGSGTILHYDGTHWQVTPTGTDVDIQSIASNGHELFAGGRTGINGVFLQWVGGHWVQLAMPSFDTLNRLGNLTASGNLLFLTGTVDTATTTQRSLAFAGTLFPYAATETTCSGFWDDDGDGAIDCSDSDCAGAATCTNGGACGTATVLACGAMQSGSTIGGPTRWSAYGCSNREESGPEQYFRFVAPASGNATITLSGFTGDLDVVLVRASPDGACLPDSECLAARQRSTATETLTAALTGGETYFVIVDGHGGSASNFSLSLTCP